MTFNENLDRSGMKDEILSWPGQVAESWEYGSLAGDKSPCSPPRALIWAGMGGSAIGGDYCAALIKAQASFPLLVHRGGGLPAWAGPEDRLLAVSFSGDTAETLAAVEEAAYKGVAVDVLTSGGKLAAWAEKNGIDPWIVPGGRPPRTALGDLFTFAYAVFSARGWLRHEQNEPFLSIEVLRRLNEDLSAPPRDDSLLSSWIQLSQKRFPMIYGTGCMAPVARRWACQMNENAKRPAHWGVLPEMNHNEVVAFQKGAPWADRCLVILLVDPDSPQDILARVKGTARLAGEAGWPVLRLEPKAKSRPAGMLELTLYGDWLSYWLALSAGIDPTPIEPINTLKAILDAQR